MNATLCIINFGLFTLTITGWKLVGFLGGAGFALRWVVQAWHRHRTGTAEIPTAFWIISLISPTLLVAYFTLGKNDSVGVMSNLFPIFIAAYNLRLDFTQQRNDKNQKKTDGPTT